MLRSAANHILGKYHDVFFSELLNEPCVGAGNTSFFPDVVVRAIVGIPAVSSTGIRVVVSNAAPARVVRKDICVAIGVDYSRLPEVERHHGSSVYPY